MLGLICCSVYSLDVPLVVVLLLHEAPLPGDEVLDVLAQLEHLHAAALGHLTPSQTGRGLTEVKDSFTENSVLHQDGLDTFLKYTDGVIFDSVMVTCDSKTFRKFLKGFPKEFAIFCTIGVLRESLRKLRFCATQTDTAQAALSCEGASADIWETKHPVPSFLDKMDILPGFLQVCKIQEADRIELKLVFLRGTEKDERESDNCKIETPGPSETISSDWLRDINQFKLAELDEMTR